MKNKKLFAILTLVCFMFTLMPVAAFAAEAGDGYVTVNTKDSTSVKVGETVKANVFDKDGKVVKTTESFYYWAEDAKENVIALGDGEKGNEFVFDTVETVYVYAVEADEKTTAKVFADPVATPEEIVDVIKVRYDKLIVDDALEVKVKKAEYQYALKLDKTEVNIKADKLLRKFILSGGFEVD